MVTYNIVVPTSEEVPQGLGDLEAKEVAAMTVPAETRCWKVSVREVAGALAALIMA